MAGIRSAGVEGGVAAVEGGGAVHAAQGQTIAGGHALEVGHGVASEAAGIFLATRCDQGLRSAVDTVLSAGEYASSFGRDTVPYLKGMVTSDGIPLSTVNRTAALYGGNAALNPSGNGAC